MSHTSRIALACSTALLAAAVGTTTAEAAQPQPQPADNCVVDVETGTSQCFSTFRQAIASTTDGRITDAPLSGEDIDQRLVERLRAPSGARGTQDVQLGIVYQHSNYGGTSVIYSAGSGCQSGNGRDHQADLTGGMDNAVSSLTTVTCWLELWDAPGTGGTHQEYRQATSYVGDAMNDRASSVAFL
ncbi:hypothetical protein GPA10_29675 [Streptomyces sp. p1417]|uniref:Peptidase inhibitor family I36 n=1 Tax=Streptomyces typhae TaxID=2681492 RepID=A0A6L6X4Y4_9ACTN|nr:hypothetical protein [Streptomyces typhae]MVO88816.1 hypothetical protein [Streptomyces typhae]